MDHLKSIVHSLDVEDYKEFKIFLNRSRKKSSRKDLDLFLLLQEEKEYSRDELLLILYPEDKNLEAYHATRKRLIKQLNEFIYLQRIKRDSTRIAQITSNISLCEHLFEKKKEETAWHYVQKTEELATKGEHYGLLNQLYRLAILYSLTEGAPPFQDLLNKKQVAEKYLLQEEKAEIANILIRNQLNESLSKGEDIDIERLVQKTLRTYNLDKVAKTNPKMVLNIIEIARTIVLAKKDFFSFEPYIINQYNELEQNNLFNAYNHEIKVKILYMITHVLYRNRKWKEALRFASLLQESMQAYKQKCERQYFQKYHLLVAGIYTYSGEVNKGITLLETAIKHKYASLDTTQNLNTYINLAIYYFFKKSYNQPLILFRDINHTDKWYTKTMGQEWLLKKQILEVMNHYELGNTDYVENRIKAIKRAHKGLFNRAPYDRALSFLNLLNRLNNKPFLATTPEFHDLVEKSFDFLPKEMEDLQAMTFYAWIKAKMFNKDYYDTLVELANN
ncbi:MAG: hypothetical protein GY827_08555 [Cytophagales bacterium]|nr:hypothetical protein [Cytophagales bacterium]